MEANDRREADIYNIDHDLDVYVVWDDQKKEFDEGYEVIDYSYDSFLGEWM